MINEKISAFAFFTDKEIEKIIDEQTDKLKEKNIRLESLILSFIEKCIYGSMARHWVSSNPNALLEEFDEHFGIKV